VAGTRRARVSMQRPNTIHYRRRQSRRPGMAGRVPQRRQTFDTTASTPPAPGSAIDPTTVRSSGFYQHTPTTPGISLGNNELVRFDYQDKAGKNPEKPLLRLIVNGFFYVVDRNNVKLANGLPFVDYITWASPLDLKTGRPVETKARRPARLGARPGKTQRKR